MDCTKCGKKLPDGSNICSSCGIKILKNRIVTIYNQQQVDRPKINDIIQNNIFDDKIKENIFDFILYLKSLKMTPHWEHINSWSLNYKKKRVGYIKLNENKKDWSIWCYSQYDKNFETLLMNEPNIIKEYIMENIIYCYNCSACTPGKNMLLLGKELEKICATPNIRFENPNENFLNFAKNLIVLRREAIENNKVPKNSYIAIKNRK